MKKGKKLILSLIIITAALLSAFLTVACGCVFFSDSADDPQWVDDVASVIKPIYIPDTSYQQSCFDSVLKYIPPRFIIHPEKIKRLESRNFQLVAKDVKVMEDNPELVSFTLYANDKMADRAVRWQSESKYSYISKDNSFEDFTINCGTLNFYNGRVILTGKNQIISTVRSDMETKQIVAVEDSYLAGSLVDSIPNEKGWMVAFANTDAQGFAQLDRNGRLTDEIYKLPNGYIAYVNSERINGGYGGRGYNRSVAVFGTPHMIYTDKNGENIMFSHRTRTAHTINLTAIGYDYFVYNLKNNWAAKPVNIVQSRNSRTNYGILSFEIMPEYDEKNAPYKYVAYTYEDGRFIHWTPLDESLLPSGFAPKRMDISLINSGNTISLRRGVPHNDIYHIDMTTGEITKEDMVITNYEILDYSRNVELGCNTYQKGDEISYRYYCRNYTTNKTVELCVTDKPMTNGIHIGLLENGNIFLMTETDYSIWDDSCADSQPYFRMSDYFAFGDNPRPGLSYRKLLAARHDTPAQSVLFVYQDFEKNPDDTVMPTVKVALVTKEGENPYIHTTDMWYSDDKVYRITLDDATTAHLYAYDRNGDIQAYWEGTLDLANSVYTKIK